VGFYFGREIQRFTGQPVGLIGSSWGGTRINSWTSLETLQSVPAMASMAKTAVEFRNHYDNIKTTYETVTEPRWQETLAKWKEDNKTALNAYPAAMKEWEQKSKAAVAAGQPPPPRPVAPKQPNAPLNPLTNNQTSSGLFNGMIAPIIPFGLKGVIWYQGESNGDEFAFYRIALPALINDWRKHWGQGDFPFLYVQLPCFADPKPEPSESGWAATRESQAKTLELPNTGMAVTIDIGDKDVHPPDKLDVGLRLALVARHVAYGEELVYTGPTYKNATVEGNKIRIAFDHVGSGLAIGRAPDYFYSVKKPPLTPPPLATELQGFAIASADGKYVWAKAEIDGNSVLVWNDGIPNPATVRYAWAYNPSCNLYNKEGLPACPFRTDDFPGVRKE
jgi:sialate O-acetylesterase